MTINRNNYEVIFIDYIDGKLSPEEEATLHAFLDHNPDLAAELELVREAMSFSSDIDVKAPSFEQKNSLKKEEIPIAPEELDRLILGEFDNTNTSSENLLLENLSTQFPSVEHTRKILALTRLTGELIPFAEKHKVHYPSSVDLQDPLMKLVAFVEGDLGEKESAEFRNYAASNADIAPVIRILEKAHLVSGSAQFENKQSLAIPEKLGMLSEAELLVAKMEGDLTLQESARLNKILSSSPSLQKDLVLLQKTKLTPSAYTFEKKHLLKRTSATIIPMRRFILAASSAAAVLAIALFLVSREKSHPAQMANATIPETHWRVETTPAAPLNASEDSTSAIDQMPNKKTPVKNIYQNHSEDTALASDSSNNNQRTPLDLKMIPSHGTQPFDIAYHPAIVANTPEMKQVLQPISNPIANAKSEPITMFAYLSQKAVEKLENTYAYSFAEKQYEKISEKTKEDVVIEKNVKNGDENKAEELRIRIGGFEYKKNISEKSKSKNSTLDKLERLYHKINGQS